MFFNLIQKTNRSATVLLATHLLILSSMTFTLGTLIHLLPAGFAEDQPKETSPPTQSPCGIAGSVSQRILDCKKIQKLTSKNFTWTLVTRTESLFEVWQDDNTQHLWSDLVKDKENGVYTFSFKNAQALCSNSKYLEYMGFIENAEWRLPKIEQFLEAEDHGIREILPRFFPRFFWSATPTDLDKMGWWERRSCVGFGSLDGKAATDYCQNSYFIRCIGESSHH